MKKSDGQKALSIEVVQSRVDEHGMKIVFRGAMVVLGNAALLALMAAFPFDDPMRQLIAGSVAIFLHGWGAWEIGKGIAALSRASKALATWSAEAFKEQALTARRKVRLFPIQN